METVQRAVIVAAGVGNRLRPVTLEIPKPLVEVNGVRMIDTQIQALRENGIHEIYIVVGYKEERFREAFADDRDIHLIRNPYYMQGNNITSLYMARNYLADAFVLEGDLTLRDTDILSPAFDRSCYLATWMEPAPEWALDVTDGRITGFRMDGGGNTYRLWGISMWTKSDGEKLSRFLEEQFEKKKDWSVYWDELPLSLYAEHFDLGVRPVAKDALREIDSLAELAAIDPTYCSYLSEPSSAAAQGGK